MPALRPGEVFAGDFHIVRLLAEGGMGTVYVAEQVSTGKQRALKLLKSEFARDPRTRERFEQEARVASRIESEHIVEVLSAGIDAATDTPWIAMELLEGRDLATYLREHGAISPREARPILGQIGHALGAAHRAGVVHRDLKPENVFIATTHQRDRNLVVKVLDFGIAKMIAEARAAQHDTAAVGTPRWMAPEQADAGGRVSPATDVWAFGLLAFLLLTGQVFWRSAHGDGGVMGMMREVLFDPIPAASARALDLGVRTELPPGFDVWFSRCLQREPLERFSDAESAAAALDAVLAGARSVRPSGTPPVYTPSGSPNRASGTPPRSPSGGPVVAGNWTQSGGTFDPTLAPSWAGASAAAPANVRGAGIAANDGCASWKIAAAIGGAVLAIGLLVLGALFVIGAVSSSAHPSHPDAHDADSDLTGSWTIAAGNRVGGMGTYQGSVVFARMHDNYRINWALTRGAGYEGIGVLDGSTLGVAWSNMNGYMLYMFKLEGTRLRARVFGADGRPIGSEELDGPAGFSGSYTLTHGVGMNGLYTGRVTITPHGDCYTLAWTTNRGVWAGIGLKSRDGYVVGAMPNGHQAGVVAYDIVTPHRLSGRFAVMGDPRVGTELLLKK